MKRFFIIALALTLTLSFLLPLTACSPALEPVDPLSETEEVKTGDPAEKKTEEGAKKPSIMQAYDPKEDEIMNVLMIGNSACYYYVEELYGVAKAAGIDMKVCNLYYSGCNLIQHWNWWVNMESNYQYFVTDGSGRKKYENYSLVKALQQENWDVITLQDAFSPNKAADREKSFNSCEPYMTSLMKYLRKQFPQSEFYWHQTWSYEVGYDRDNGKIDSPEAQEAHHTTVRDVSLWICENHNLKRIPVGDAWQIARKDPVIGDVLCHKFGKVGDFLHDGDTGGGQYLNACVWLECITGQSCIGNTWRPDYDLSEEKILALQKDAHRAVEEMRG